MRGGAAYRRYIGKGISYSDPSIDRPAGLRLYMSDIATSWETTETERRYLIKMKMLHMCTDSMLRCLEFRHVDDYQASTETH